MSAELLRRAAAKIRETAQAVSPTGRAPGPWVVYEGTRRDGTPHRGVGVGDDDTGVSIFEDRYCDRTDAEHIALWSPDVGELVAEAMEAAADRVRNGRLVITRSVTGRLVAVARRVLGEDA